MKLLGAIGRISVVAAASLTPVAGYAPAQAPPPAPGAPAGAQPLRRLHLRFSIEPGPQGHRTLLLRDSDDLRLPLGELDPSWACDTNAEYRGCMMDTRVLQVGCGGGALEATVSVAFDRDVPKAITVRSSTGVGYTIPREPGLRIALDPQLRDPDGDCIPGPTRPVDVLLDEKSHGLTHRPYDVATTMHLRSSTVPLDASVRATQTERCALERDSAGTELVLRCWYPDEPHADIIDVRIRDGAMLWTTVDESVGSGGSVAHGGWRLGCGQEVAWPRQARIVTPLEFSIPAAPSDETSIDFRER